MKKEKIFSRKTQSRYLSAAKIICLSFLFSVPVQVWAESFEDTPALNVVQQQKSVKGTVVDATGEPVIGANIKAQGTDTGTITDLDGNFSLVIPASAKLEISFIGYVTQVVAVPANGVVKITLAEDSKLLDEVVVVGYGTQKKAHLTGSISTVNPNDLKEMPYSNMGAMLAGTVAGLNVSGGDGRPGVGATMTIRDPFSTGVSGSTTAPIYVIDGVIQSDNPRNGISASEAFNNLDPNEIESISILKDAAAAVYGARGAQGAIIVTTKKGSVDGKPRISYTGSVTMNDEISRPKMLDAYQYGQFWNGFKGADGNESIGNRKKDLFQMDELEAMKGMNYDWLDKAWSAAYSTKHNVNISGGSEKTKYMLSYNYTGEDGIMDKHGYQKNSIRAKINHELWKGVRFDFSSSLQMTKIDGGGSLGGTLKQTILQPVTGGVKWTNEQLLGSDLADLFSEMYGGDNYDANNPIINNQSITNEKYTRMATVNAGLEIDILKDLTFRTSGSYMWQQVRKDYWDNGNTKTASSNQSPYGYGYRNNSEKFSWQITNTLNYAFNVKEAHRFNVLLGQETWYQESMNLDNEYRKFSDGNFGLNDVSMGTPQTWKSGKSRVGLVSLFGRLSYNYSDRYLFTGTLRADGSSKFARGQQWGYFPSASAAWRISEEGFMKDFDFFQNLKLRVGYGTSGNNNVDNNMYATDYGSGHYGYNGSDYITLVPGTTLGNPKLKWEKTTTTNVALDISILNSRVNLSVDWYNNESSNLLIKNQIPTSTGYTHQFQNIGSIRNRGVELVLNTTNIRTKDFTWTMDFNIAFNRSKVLDIYGDGETDNFITEYESRMGFKIEKGKPLGQFFGLIYDGIYTTDDFTQNADGSYTLNAGVPYLKGSNRENVKPGDAKYRPTAGEVDADGNPVWGTNDRTVIGNAAPDFVGGWNNTFTYKGFDLTIFMNFVVGNDVFNMSTQRFIGPYLANQNTLEKMKNRFTLIDPSTGKESSDLARLAALNPHQYDGNALWNISGNNKTAISERSSYYLEDGSYLRLNTITLGYTLPKKLVQRAKISNARVYCTLNNIHTFTDYTGYDPEVSASSSALTPGIDNSSYPRSKSWVVGVNLTF